MHENASAENRPAISPADHYTEQIGSSAEGASFAPFARICHRQMPHRRAHVRSAGKGELAREWRSVPHGCRVRYEKSAEMTELPRQSLGPLTAWKSAAWSPLGNNGLVGTTRIEGSVP